MNAKAGIVTSQVAWLGAVPFLLPDWKAIVVGFPIALVSSYGPDLDHDSSTAGRNLGRLPKVIRRLSGGHRMGMHSLVAMLGFGKLVGFLLLPTAGLAVTVGWGAHILCDALTVQGIAFFWPFLNRKFSIGWMVTGQWGEGIYIKSVQGTGVLLLGFYVALYGGFL